MIEKLIAQLDEVIALHKRNGDMWSDHFEAARDKILKDAAFGCEYLIMAWHGIGGYDDERIFANDEDEKRRKAIHPQLYKMALEVRNDSNKAA
jgi:hypothetical protein